MNSELKTKVMDKIGEIYPKFRKDALVLGGSRALGWETETSDIDIDLFTEDIKYYREISVARGFRKKTEDVGFEVPMDNGLLLEVHVHDYKIGDLDIFWVNDLINFQVLIPNKKFSAYKQAVINPFLTNYDKILMKNYIHFFDELKQMEGMSKRKDELAKINFLIKKGVVLQAFFRLILIMQKKPYSSDKWLYHFVAKTKYFSKIKEFVPKFLSIESFDQVESWKKEVRNFINPRMPQEDYVNNWWKYLNEFSKLK